MLTSYTANFSQSHGASLIYDTLLPYETRSRDFTVTFLFVGRVSYWIGDTWPNVQYRTEQASDRAGAEDLDITAQVPVILEREKGD